MTYNQALQFIATIGAFTDRWPIRCLILFSAIFLMVKLVRQGKQPTAAAVCTIGIAWSASAYAGLLACLIAGYLWLFVFGAGVRTDEQH